MPQILVTATRDRTSAQDVAANVSVVTRGEIDAMPVSNAAEVLQHVPGVYVEFNGGLGSLAAATIQGSEVRHVAVFQDGVPLNQLGNPLTDLSYLPVGAIERIEVYKGSASSAWGSALGGVINIITREPDPKKPFEADVRTSLGEFDTAKWRSTLSGAAGRSALLVSVTHDESDGFIEHTAFRQNAVYAKINYDLPGTTRLNFAYSHDTGRSDEPVPSYPNFWDDNHRRRTYQRLLFETAPNDDLVLTAEARHHRFYNRIEDVYSDHKDVYNDYLDAIWGLSASVDYHPAKTNALRIGFDEDWGKFDYESEVLGVQTRAKTRDWAVYANDTFRMAHLSLNAGVRYDNNRDFGSQVSPSGGAVYRMFGNAALLRAQVAKGFSAPPAYWVHDLEFGNPDLKPESSINYQFGLEVRPRPFVRLGLNVFRADIDHMIDYNATTRRYENIDKVSREGLEATVNVNTNVGLRVALAGTFVDVRDETTHEVIPDRPRRLYHVSATYESGPMAHNLTGRYIYHHSSYPETNDKIFVFDYLFKLALPLQKRYGKLSLFAAVYNLTDASYIYREMFPQPGRWVKVGLRFQY